MRPRTLDLELLRTFSTVVDVGTVTRAAERLDYTQSAVSMQLRRLEDQTGAVLLRRAGRGLVLTGEGQTLLGYARRLLALNDQALAELQTRPASGVVRLGIATDYTFMLPSVLGWFGQLYPLVELAVHDDLSVDLVAAIRRGELDLAVVTRQRNSPGGEVLRREPLIWVTGRDREPALEDPLPLALFPPGKDIFREMAIDALEAAGRSWRVACVGQSFSGLRPALHAGLAISVITRSMLTPDLRPLDASTGLPTLPAIEIALHRPPGRPSEPARQLATLIEAELAGEIRSPVGA